MPGQQQPRCRRNNPIGPCASVISRAAACVGAPEPRTRLERQRTGIPGRTARPQWDLAIRWRWPRTTSPPTRRQIPRASMDASSASHVEPARSRRPLDAYRRAGVVQTGRDRWWRRQAHRDVDATPGRMLARHLSGLPRGEESRQTLGHPGSRFATRSRSCRLFKRDPGDPRVAVPQRGGPLPQARQHPELVDDVVG